jgi:hypothetical protein
MKHPLLVGFALALVALGACDIPGQPCGILNTSACATGGGASGGLRTGDPLCCMPPTTTPFSCTKVVHTPAVGDYCSRVGICALSDSDAIGQVEIQADHDGVTLAQTPVCTPSFCTTLGQPAGRRLPRHPFDTDAGPIEVEDFDGGASSCGAGGEGTGTSCTANAGDCTADTECCSGICSESGSCEACRMLLEGCTTNAECCSNVCSLNGCGTMASGAGGGSQ